MKMKRLMAVLLCTLTVAALASCTPKQPHTDANATTTATTTAATTKKADVQTTTVSFAHKERQNQKGRWYLWVVSSLLLPTRLLAEIQKTE